MPSTSDPSPSSPKRIDLHCHSDASNSPTEAALKAIHCPESYSHPEEVYAQAKNRGMDFVTLTDHDSIAGALTIAHRDDVLVGEELTCWFPEDNCKMHVLMWGIDQQQHDELQAISGNIYEVAGYFEKHRIAHAVAHPLYRQNDKLERWHLERLILLFKGFECLNGAHSILHRDAFEPMLNRLNRQEIQRLADIHLIVPRWPEPWTKARTAGSDDHGLLNIGRTWTEFPDHVATTDQLLQCIREGDCRPGGETGTSIKLAHNFYGVAVRYYSRHILPARSRKKPNLAITLLQTLVGERPALSKGDLAKMVLKHKARKWSRRLTQPFRREDPNSTTNLIRNLFLTSARGQFPHYPQLRETMGRHLPPLGEHDEMFQFVSGINRDVTQGIARAVDRAIDDGRFGGLFDAISAGLAQQFVLLPYYFAFFHQNRERHLLQSITGHSTCDGGKTMKVGLFTDTLEEINGVGRFIRDMSEQAALAGRKLTIHTCSSNPRLDLPYRKNFTPLLARSLPYYPELQLNLPPITEILEWADRQQFDAIHVSTPGPMGICGWIVSKMLRVPMLGTYHTDFPAYVENLTSDHRMTRGTTLFMSWFYKRMAMVFSRSLEYHHSLTHLGVEEAKMTTMLPGINTDKFNPRHRDGDLWLNRGVREPLRLLYCGRVSVEKNLPLLVEAYKQLCERRRDVALVVAGDGPYLATMREELKGLPAYFLGYQNDGQLGALYASADLFVFPSRTDTLGQVVMEAQASGLPVLVSDEGGPKEMMDNGLTGVMLPAMDAVAWSKTMDELLSDESRRRHMAHSAPSRINRFSLAKTFEHFWSEHAAAVQRPPRIPANHPFPPREPISA